MAEKTSIYQRYSDEVARLSIITIQTGTPPDDLTNYGPEVLVDDNPARLAKIESETGAWQFEFPAKQIIEVVGLIHHDFDEGADVKIQGNATAAWGAPAFSASIIVPAWLGVGSRRWPINPWLDLTEQAGYDATGFKFWRLVITGNSQDLQLGQVWFGLLKRRLDDDIQWDYIKTSNKRIIENKTAFGVSTIYARGTTEWKLEGGHLMSDVLQASLEEQWYDVDGRSHPWLLVPDGLTNRCYFVRYADTMRAVTHQVDDVHSHQFRVEEVARGLRPGE